MKLPIVRRQVFADDLEREFGLIQSVIAKFPVVSLDTEFPGTIYKENKEQLQLGDPRINYQYLKANVDALQIIQLGLTLSDSEGNLPNFGTPYSYIWEFNFKDFNAQQHPHDKESIKLLERQGIDFVKNQEEGVDSRDFAKMLLTSGLVFSGSWLTWLTFHGGYDFGFLVKLLTQKLLPNDVDSFIGQLARLFGCNVYDVKHSFRFFGLHGGLEKVAKELKVDRVAGASHQAGSDSLLTMQCFMKLKQSNSKDFYECLRNDRMLPPLALYGLNSARGRMRYLNGTNTSATASRIHYSYGPHPARSRSMPVYSYGVGPDPRSRSSMQQYSYLPVRHMTGSMPCFIPIFV